MLNRSLEIKKVIPRKFQIFFLRNDSSQNVTVHEVHRVDFLTVQQHLEEGESVFITSKSSQKIHAPKEKKSKSSVNYKGVTAFYLDRT